MAIKRAIDDRLKNPLMGSILLTWLLFHWEVIVLFSFGADNPTVHTSRVTLINEYITSQGTLCLVVWPIVFGACIYVVNQLVKKYVMIKFVYDRIEQPISDRKALMDRQTHQIKHFGADAILAFRNYVTNTGSAIMSVKAVAEKAKQDGGWIDLDREMEHLNKLHKEAQKIVGEIETSDYYKSGDLK